MSLIVALVLGTLCLAALTFATLAVTVYRPRVSDWLPVCECCMHPFEPDMAGSDDGGEAICESDVEMRLTHIYCARCNLGSCFCDELREIPVRSLRGTWMDAISRR